MMMKYLIPFLTFLLFSHIADLVAQHPLYLDNLDLLRDNRPLKLNNVGGFNAPQYSAIDLNNDGIEDLLVFDRATNMAYTFLNKGTPNTIDYVFAPEYMSRFDLGAQNFMLARDFNCDGIADLFYYTSSATTFETGIQVMKGSYDSDNKIQFTLAKDFLKYDTPRFSGNYIFMYNPDIPAIVDIDNDGDMDILAFTLDIVFSRNVFFYKNMSMERGYGCDSLNFQLFNECFGQFSETDINNTVIYSGRTDSCAGNPYWRHVGSTLSSFDHNGDGIEDLVMGDVDINTLNLLTLSQVNDTLLVSQQDANFPHYDTPVDVYTFPAAYFLDVNNDGKKDMIVANNDISALNSVKDSTSWLYLNQSNSAVADFALYTKGFMYEDMLDFGLDAQPVFVDLDKDGLIDIVVANTLNVQNNTTRSAGLVWLKNIGTATTPQYIIADTDLASLRALNVYGIAVSFADLNNDGWQDMLISYDAGSYRYYENRGLDDGTIKLEYTPSSFDNIYNTQSNYNIPTLYDLDEDGDFDLVVGTYRGHLLYFENIGSRYYPIVNQHPTNSNFGGIDTYNSFYASRTSAHFFRDSETGELRLLVGLDQNYVLLYGDISNNLTGNFSLLDSNYQDIKIGTNQRLTIADINQDGKFDILVGNTRGGLTFYSSKRPSLIAVEEIASVEHNFPSVQLFPNPSRDITQLSFETPSALPIRLQICNPIGQILYTNTISPFSKNYPLNLSNFAAGIYYIHLYQDYMQKTLILNHQP